MDPILSVLGMIVAFGAAFAFAYPAALIWKERGVNIISICLGLAALPFVIGCLVFMDKLIDSITRARDETRRGFPITPDDDERPS